VDVNRRSSIALVGTVVLVSGAAAFVAGAAADAHAARAAMPTTGLIGYWPLDGNFNDASGNGHDGTAVGNPTPATGVRGGAYSFDGASGIDVGNLPIRRTYTVSIWAQTDEGPIVNVYRSMIDKLDPRAGGPVELYTGTRSDTGADQGPSYAVWHGGATDPNIFDSHRTLRDHGWHMLTATFRKGGQKLYFDGVLIGHATSLSKLPVNTTSVRIGGHSFGSYHHPWVGRLDEVAIYGQVLTAAQVQDLYQSTGPASGS
jgi:hypothetical protein